MKKTTAKSKSPAPATRSSKTPKKKASATAAAANTSVNAVAPLAPVLPAVAAALTTEIPAAAPTKVKAVKGAPVQTTIVARIDVGYGNALYLRGDGPGLSWEQGVPMECIAGDQWQYTLGESARPISFKVLLNDQIWSAGPDSVVASGSTATITPDFP